MAIVSVRNIKKTYNKGKVVALRDLSFDVEEGEIYGIIGPDGAGKTSLFRILTTLLLADRGTASVDGLDVLANYKEIRKRIGYMPGKFSLYQDLSIEENLEFFATIFGTTIEENYNLVKDIYQQIEKFKTRKAGKLSGGMKQKLALSCALIHAPRVLFLDEPTTGVDPVSRKEFWEMLKKLQKEHGITIIVSTPYMDEAMQCDRIALIQDGEFLKIDFPQGIIASYQEQLWAVRSDEMHQLLGDLREYPSTKTAFSFGEKFHVTLSDDNKADSDPAASRTAFSSDVTTQVLVNYLSHRGHHNVSVAPIEASIEDCFMALMK